MNRSFVFAVALALGAVLPAQAADLKPVKRVEPQYPPEAARAGTTGYVDVEFEVDPTGKVAAVSVVSAKPTRTFEQAAVRAVKQWQFEPGGGKGKVRLSFSL
ncbi:energy transducer TonB [Cognatilysobacter lacus]|uniref:Protein TonB n=1 Tax=Cognatilysobacter lacus TaxID=1643323 RepID=A0A5D8Z5C1_9GAMM|nr:energy transducer TonB [Lysobacter lacus]TZF89939.1 energy transducer TonB [Lysobacter lacus]